MHKLFKIKTQADKSAYYCSPTNGSRTRAKYKTIIECRYMDPLTGDMQPSHVQVRLMKELDMRIC